VTGRSQKITRGFPLGIESRSAVDGEVLGRHMHALLARRSVWGRRAGGLDKPGPLLGESGEGLSSGRPARQFSIFTAAGEMFVRGLPRNDPQFRPQIFVIWS
jgi:hypothetical protein